MTIDKSSWTRIQAHFDSLIELPPESRESALEALELRPEDRDLLQALLRSHDQADPLLDSGSAPALLNLARDEAGNQDWAGRRLGPWEVEGQIARGGMSVVHRGRRADGQFEKTVAIKVLDADQLAADQRHRLTEEVRILARLEHPGLARLIDSGQSADGDPYLVMEYVTGDPLNDYVGENHLGIGQRIDLIIQVARALLYAHQRQVIHSDVKPANILVTSSGQARLVDFGIASLNRGDQGNETRLYCSPAYAAPERLHGAPPTTSQDIFALGAVLYRLLSGRNIRPHDSITGTRITEQPTPPSIATTQAVHETANRPIVARELKGDLDAICMKAIAVDPDERYASLSEFIADLEAWRDHRPVAARNGGRSYVLARWLRRHTAIATLGLLLVAALISGTVIALDQARRANDHAERAMASRDFLVSILEAADPTLEDGRDPTASELLRRGAERIDAELNDQPELLIELLHIIGKTQLQRGLSSDAKESLDRAHQLLSDEPAHPQGPNILANRGLAAYQLGRYPESIEWLEQAAAAADQQGVDKADRHGIKTQLADMLVINNQPARALALTSEVLNDSPAPIEEIAALRMRGNAFEISDQYKDAEQSLLRALELQQNHDPADVYIGMIQNDLGIVYWRMQDYSKSAEMSHAAWRQKREIYGPDHPGTQASLSNMAMAYSAMGDHAAAETALLESLAALERTFGDTPHPDLASTYSLLARAQYLQDDIESARHALDQGMAQLELFSEGNHSLVPRLAQLDALLRLDSGQPIALDQLDRDVERCRDLAAMSPFSRRVCLAWWWLETEPPAQCPETAPESPDATIVASWPLRWQGRWTAIQQRCPPQP